MEQSRRRAHTQLGGFGFSQHFGRDRWRGAVLGPDLVRLLVLTWEAETRPSG
jgi:hypothetical protein